MHDLDRHGGGGAPGDRAEEGELDAGEDVAALGPAGGQDGVAGADHVRRGRVVADGFQREVGLDAGGDVEGAVVEQRPAAVVALDAAEIDADLGLEHRVDAVEVVFQQDVFGRDGGVRLQLEDPVAVLVLAPQQGGRGWRDGGVERRVVRVMARGAGPDRLASYRGASRKRLTTSLAGVGEYGGGGPAGPDGTFDGRGQAGGRPVAREGQVRKRRASRTGGAWPPAPGLLRTWPVFSFTTR